MRSAFVAGLFMAALVAGPGHAAPAQDLQSDLTFASAAIRSDHPGFVAGVDAALVKTERLALGRALRAARRAETDAHYRRVMSEYVGSFRDPHVALSLVSEPGVDGPAESSAASSLTLGELRPLGSDRWLLVLPTFYAGHPAFDSVAAAIKLATERFGERRPETVIIDLRGNGGGSSSPADAVLRALWGETAPDALSARRARASVWRASSGVISELKSKRERIAARYPEALAGFDRLLSELKSARSQGRALHRMPLPRASSATALSAGPAKVAVITDEACISACLDFMDRLLEAPGVTHLGRPTGSDTLYTEVRSLALTSGRGSITVPMQMLAGRKRASGATYVPSVPLRTSADVDAWLTGDGAGDRTP